MTRDKRRAFPGTLFGTFNAAFPFKNGPAVVIGFRQQGEDSLEIDLSVSQRAKTAGTRVPGLVAAIDTHPAVGSEFRIFYMKCLDAIAVKFDEIEVVQLLKQKMAGIVSQAGGRVVEQLIRPTGLIDPNIEVRPVAGQVDDLLEEMIDDSRD